MDWMVIGSRIAGLVSGNQLQEIKNDQYGIKCNPPQSLAN